jgi:hypothetical protein
MRHLLLKLWRDDCGALITVEWLFVGTILVIGLVAGLGSLRNHITNELDEFGSSVSTLNQCYSVLGLTSCASGTCSYGAADQPDVEDTVSKGVDTKDIDTNPCD